MAAIQAVCVASAALVATLASTQGSAVALLYGGLASLANTGLLIWRWRRGVHDYHCDAGRHLRSFYRSSMERLVVVGVCMAIGIAGLGLAGLPMLLGFVIGQLAWMAATVSLR